MPIQDADFLDRWSDAAWSSLSYFWMALWAFCFGYTVSAGIQVFVSRERMRGAMGRGQGRGVLLGSVFGFLSSSCSFAAISGTRALFAKGAGLAPSLAFLLASTNLVVELGFVIALFLGWQYVVGEYVGGVLLILVTWAIVRTTASPRLVDDARDRARSWSEDEGDPDETGLDAMRSIDGWRRVARQYLMEWKMVWRDVAIGFTLAGVIAVFVPRSFFETLFVGAGGGPPSFGETVLHAVIGPIAAFVTFIGSMGNVPLAAVLFENGVCFAGVMAFLFSDLIVFPLLRISAASFGWRMAGYIVATFLAALVVTAVTLHWSFDALGILPERKEQAIASRERFAVDYTLFLDVAFVIASAGLWWLARSGGGQGDGHDHGGGASWADRLLTGVAALAFAWLAGGIAVSLL